MGADAAVLAVYGTLLSLLGVLGGHRLWLLGVHAGRQHREVPPDPAEWPIVTVQLPLYDERNVVDRLLQAAGNLDYPRDRLEIQVLDDSTDDTTLLAARGVERLRARGVDAVLVHRDDREGFKAGALAAGLQTARGELVAIFDADFVPPRDFLRRTVPWMASGVGVVQVRWGHLNAADSLLTRAQATLLDGHFVVEHTARHRSGRWFNFNGTAGVWRRAAIADAGGWRADTLTEDLDLSYRAQLRGWRFVYLDDVVAPAELPPTMAAFKNQQHRWAKGSMQTARKLLGEILRSPAPLGTRLEAVFHLTANVGYPMSLVISLLLPWAVLARGRGLSPFLAVDLVAFLLTTATVVAFYGVAARIAGGRWRDIPAALALGVGMGVSQTRAVAEGLLGPLGGTFVRTPKRGSAAQMVYRSAVHGLVVVEIALAAYMIAATLWAIFTGYYASVPFLALFAVGYGWVGLASARERASARSAATAGPQASQTSHGGSVQDAVAASQVDRTA